ncbi:uncharacterized flavoproteins [Firmicutes bacterium CAG:449]|nr:uncharacterized flavoproteins [Firmicutes bacterium CAG:449]
MNKVTNDVFYIGVNDHQIDLFEGQYLVPHGMSYNSYIIKDEKIAVFDTVDQNFTEEWLNNIKEVLKDEKPTYLIIQHMEPDHSANIINFLKEYPDTIIVGNKKTFIMMKQFFNHNFTNLLEVTDKQVLSLGKHNLTFIFAPMVHWPEVMVTYDDYDKILFSADGFGKFGALDVDEDWAYEARRYYIGIVGKFGLQVQALLKKASTLSINMICPLHGPILSDNLAYYLNLYDIWSSYKVEDDGIVIAYTSVYGHTKKAVEELEKLIKKYSNITIKVFDLARCDMSEAVEDAFRYNKLVLATTTYNNSIFPFMSTFIEHLIERNYQNRFIAIIDNGSWAPMATKVILDRFSNSKNITFSENNIKILSSLNQENLSQLDNLAKELIK